MSKPTKPSTTAVQYLRGVMIALALVLPTLSLAVLGTLWLWQNNALLIWGLAASGVALLIYFVELWLVRRRESELEISATPDTASQEAADHRTPREQAAWAAVEQIAVDVKPDTLDNRDAVLALGVHTVEAVARSMHPDQKDPLWKFTVPEALALVERVSRQLNQFVIESVPLGDRLTIGQVLTVYRWRSFATVAEKAYDLWRILRFINPATAIAGELREKVSGQLLDGMRTEFTRRLARAYVREVGQAAIDLYSGRLRPDLREALDTGALPEVEARAPLDILIVGQGGVGKSSLVNALGDEVQAAVDVVPLGDNLTTHLLSRDDAPLTHISESPGLDGDQKRTQQILDRAAASDAIIWVISAIRPDRAADAAALDELRISLAQHHDRRPPPIVYLLTNVDRVRPFNEWAPPYDLTDKASAKAGSISEAIAAVTDDLGVAESDIIPVAIGQGRATYNIDLVWAQLLDVSDEARNVQLLRRLSSGIRTPITKSLWRQALGAGRVIRKTMFD
ncbi:MAG: putative GTPase [Hyphomicrobiaceae bacterium]|jgi:predicted GTPase